MPELPEVETIKRGLEKVLIGQSIKSVEVLWSNSMSVEEQEIADNIIDAEIVGITRRGKVLIIDLSSQYSLLIHLKMTGQLVLDSSDKRSFTRLAGGHPTKSLAADLPDNSTRAVFTTSEGHRLFFNDQRKFGWIKLVKSKDISSQKLLQLMGPEPLESSYSLKEFAAKLSKTSRPIKAVILDQTVVAGVGNIYADEALHLAKVHPLKPAKDLSQAQVKRIFEAIPTVMRLSLDYGGTSFTNYVNANGLKGDYLANARVFRREDQKCLECGVVIEKIRVAGRGTHICPKCQKL